MAGKNRLKKSKGLKQPAPAKREEDYRRVEAQSPLRRDVGTQGPIADQVLRAYEYKDMWVTLAQ